MQIYKKEANMLKSISKNLPNKVTGTSIVLSEADMRRVMNIKSILARMANDLSRIS